jgi:hypothetical protein
LGNQDEGTEHGTDGRRPYAFTVQGVAMLSSVLRSPRAIAVNIEIMRAFVRRRHILATHADLARKLDALENKYDAQFRVVFEAIRELMAPFPEPKRGKFGFARDREDDSHVSSAYGDSRQAKNAERHCSMRSSRNAASSPSTNSAWAGFNLSRASVGSNHSQRSTSGNVCHFPDLGGHSIRIVLLGTRSGSAAPSHAQAWITFPAF